jgi:hypothetical protein
MLTAEHLCQIPLPLEFRLLLGLLKMYESPGVDEIPAEPIQSGAEALRLEVYKLSKFGWKKELPR